MRRFARPVPLLALLAALLLVLGAGGARGLLAQETVTPGADETPAPATGRPVHVHTGSCGEELGGVVQPLTNLDAPAGDAEGQGGAVVAESSFTTVPMALDDMLAADHAINAHLSTEEAGTYIACGEIGGVRDATGSLVIGLKEQNDSGFTGIAFLAPNVADATQTDISVFIAESLAEDAEDTDATEDEEETAEADETPTPGT